MVLVVAKLVIQRKPNQKLFDEIIGCEDVKRLFRMALDSAEPVDILLSAKTLFLQALMKLTDTYFVDGSNTTKLGMIDYILGNKPKHITDCVKIGRMATSLEDVILLVDMF